MAESATEERSSAAPPAVEALAGAGNRKEKRKALKKLKRKQIRKETAIKEREEEEARSNDPEEQLRIRLREQEEAEIAERARKEFEERERLWLEAAAKRKAEEEEAAARKKLLEESEKTDHELGSEEDDEWEYVEEGPAEIIWQGNEIIVKKKRVKVAKKSLAPSPDDEGVDRPTSNPLPPQSAAFASYKSGQSMSAQEALESVAQQVPNFGTEQDKAHCPFHLKTGACRFGSRCSRVHFYPDKSCTLLIKNMYNGPGLAWEQDEGLEKCISRYTGGFKVLAFVEDGDKLYFASYTDEEVERCYEEFYEDVHTEFLKFGELVNFKACKNGSYHLRGNVYVHYKSLESAVLAYNSMNGRYFAGKQITCEFIGVTRWKVAICGEYMKSRLKTCSHGTACNFIHCFRNPGGDYEWADWDNPPPKYWIRKMAALFGPSDESEYVRQTELEDHESPRNSSRKRTLRDSRYRSRRFTCDKMEIHDSGLGREESDRRRERRSSHLVRREYSRRTKETSLVDNYGYNMKYCPLSHDCSEDNSKDQDGESLKKCESSEDRNGFEGRENHKEKRRKKEDLSRGKKGDAFSDVQDQSARRRKSKSCKQHTDENASSYQVSDYTDDNREQSNRNLIEESYSRHNIDPDDRYNGGYCSNNSDSDRDGSHQNRPEYCKRAKERKETDQHRFSSDEYSDGWVTTDRYYGRRETHDSSLCNDSRQSQRKHSKSSARGQHHREKREPEGSNLGSDKYLDRREYKKRSRS